MIPTDLPANESFAGLLGEHELSEIEYRAAVAVEALLTALRIEPDHNTDKTPGRVAKMLVREIFAGRYEERPTLTDFPNARHLDQIYVVGPVSFRSCCAHHLAPILGQAWVGVLPSERIIGLSKFHRLTHWIMARPQIQEEATQQLADQLEQVIQPRGLALVVRAKHFCTVWRGVRDEASLMTTSVMRGTFREGAAAHAEFMGLIAGMGFSR